MYSLCSLLLTLYYLKCYERRSKKRIITCFKNIKMRFRDNPKIFSITNLQKKKIVVVILPTSNILIQPTLYFIFEVCFELKYSTHVTLFKSTILECCNKRYERFQNKLSIGARSIAYCSFGFTSKAFLGIKAGRVIAVANLQQQHTL